MKINSEPPAPYNIGKCGIRNDEKGASVIAEALKILQSRLRNPGQSLIGSNDVKKFLILRLAELEHEVFSVVWLDNRHRVIAFEELFRGTINGASVHPREVVKSAMRHNVSAAILAHNHPSGVAEPSQNDMRITQTLRDALALVDVQVLDHIIVGGMTTVSFAERELI